MIRPVRMTALCQRLLVASFLCACSAGADRTPAFGVLGAACTAERSRPSGGRRDRRRAAAGLGPLRARARAGRRRLPRRGAREDRRLPGRGHAHRPGTRSAVPARPGCALFPTHCCAARQAAARPTVAWTSCSTPQVRGAASAYLGQLAADLDLDSADSGITAVRVGVSGTGELAYPGPTAAGRPSTQPGSRSSRNPAPRGRTRTSPIPGCPREVGVRCGTADRCRPRRRRHGDPAAGLAAGPGRVARCPRHLRAGRRLAGLVHRTSLVDTVAWQVGRLRELGFRGAVHVPVAGRGILPADRAAAVDGLLDGRADPDGALERGLDYPSQFPVLAGLHGVVVDFTGLDDAQAVTARELGQDRCLPDDVEPARPHRHGRLAGPALDVRARPRQQRGAGGGEPRDHRTRRTPVATPPRTAARSSCSVLRTTHGNVG